ncbi:hypothetical protein [Hymenobacter crusticola]|uniref:Uncharacterized protein n=1 Tax=Hymenobacter crusticola TaxID=1770526 RepID=A0A243WFY2_9BACT|nr:hypothetical protein [Hymenobacter crusticola]OUJ74448.1 hypothetical protein BXP70_06580 [Hymenobacter crusticola]
MPVASYRYSFFLLMLLGSGACSTDKQEPEHVENAVAPTNALQELTPYFNAQWAMDKFWEDSLAEVATYAAEQTVGAATQQFDCTLLTVKEEFSMQYNVRAADYKRKDLYPVMKVNQIYSLPTTPLPQHCLTSLFFRRDQPVPLYKLTASAQDWNGVTFKAITDDGLQYVESYSSCQSQPGSGQRQLRRDVLFEEALPYTLRSLRFERKPAFGATVRAAQAPDACLPPVYYTAQIRVADGLVADTAEPAWRVAVVLADRKENVYWFAKKYPNLLLRQTTWDGRRMTLKEVKRTAYEG